MPLPSSFTTQNQYLRELQGTEYLTPILGDGQLVALSLRQRELSFE